MKAAIFKEFGAPLVVENLPDPTPNPMELVLRVEACGICGTDLHMSENRTAEGGWRLLKSGCVLGHEFSGEIVEIGKGIDVSWKKGDRVTALPWIGCGSCSTCSLGRPYRCTSVLMRSSLELPGAYAEFCRVGANEVLHLPDHMEPENGALVEPMAVGFSAVKRANVKANESVFILGAGPVGLSVALWCQFLGLEHVLITDLSRARTNAAPRFGATEAIHQCDGKISEQILDLLGGMPTVLFDCIGLPGTLQMAVDYAGPGSRIIVVGLCMESDRYFPAKALLKELDIQFSYVYSKEDFKKVIEFIGERRIDPSALITKKVDLPSLPDTFERLKKPGSELKVMLKPSEIF